jgi:septal ring factor EnvC (AmiA/AmiB activator)
MTKKIIVAAVVLFVGFWVVKKTQVCSYACAIFSNGAESVRKQIPRDLELSRVKNEIAHMDRDYQKLLRVIAERMANSKRLTEEISVAEVNRKDLAEKLAALTTAIEDGETPISYKDSKYATVAKAQARATRELNSLKQLDKTLASKKKMLEAEQRNLDALKDQLDKLVTQKREFEVRVAQLEAADAELQTITIKSPLKTDQGRVAEIKRTLDRIEHDILVDQNLAQLEDQYGSKIDGATPAAQPAPAINVQEIKDYLQGKSSTAAKVAQTK